MAEALALDFIKSIGGEVASAAFQEIRFATDISSHIESLEETKIIIQALLLDAGKIESPTHAQQALLERLSCATEEMDDLLDAKATRAKMRQVMEGSRIARKVHLLCSASLNPVLVAFRDARKVKAIRKELDSVLRDAQFGNTLRLFSSSVSKTPRETQPETGSYTSKEEVIGRDREKDIIIGMLFDNRVQEHFVVVSIVGIGGLGKTTLAQYVYNDEKVKNHFGERLWVHASKDFDMKEMLQKIIASATNEKPVNCEMEQLQQRFIQRISGKKYLMVLDNVWDHQNLSFNWEELRKLLKLGAPGSRILITTRDESVAVNIGSESYTHRLRDLAPEDSWHLFEQFAFRRCKEPKAIEIGKEIAEKCPNVPLLIRTIGGLLATKRTEEWQAFKDGQLANISQYAHKTMQILKLSYDQLDPRLKLCFALCSVFPKGFRFEKDELVRIWIALGYIKREYEKQSMVDEGEVCVVSLVNRGFFHEVEKDRLDRIVGFAMHDLIHDLAEFIAGYKFKMVDRNTHELDKRVGHVYFSEKADISLESLSIARRLRSFLRAERTSLSSPKLSEFLRSFPYLRVLSLRERQIGEVPTSIGKLIQLRHLDLSWNDFWELPKSVTQLVKLVSLDLTFCRNLKVLPRKITKLVELRQLCLEECLSLEQMPYGFGNLSKLEILDVFTARDPPDPRNSVGGLSELSTLNNLQGDLRIELRGSVSDSKAAELQKKEKLIFLYLIFRNLMGKPEEVLEGLQPPANLRRLSIRRYGGESLGVSWMRKNQIHLSLPNLVEIQIASASNCRHVGSFGRLPNLKFILLQVLDSAEYIEEEEEEESGPPSTSRSRDREDVSEIETESNAPPSFPSLEELRLWKMPKLKGWRKRMRGDSTKPLVSMRPPAFPKLKKLRLLWLGIEELPDEFRGLSSLQTLAIQLCLHIKEIPAWIEEFTSLKTLQIFGCPKLKPLPKQIGNLPNLDNIHIIDCPGAFEEWWEDPRHPDSPVKHLITPQMHWTAHDGRGGFRYSKELQ